jgi:hypothetical protein
LILIWPRVRSQADRRGPALRHGHGHQVDRKLFGLVTIAFVGIAEGEASDALEVGQ